MPEPTVTVRMKEDGDTLRLRVAEALCVCLMPWGVFRFRIREKRNMPNFIANPFLRLSVEVC